MTRWTRGEQIIERLITTGEMDTLNKATSDGLPVLEQARRRLKVASAALAIDPDGAFTNAYDAARLAATALMTQQGLRPTITGGHRAIEEALVAQFGEGFSRFKVLRRRRHELDYPDAAYSEASAEEAQDAINTAELFVEKAAQILPELGFFHDR